MGIFGKLETKGELRAKIKWRDNYIDKLEKELEDIKKVIQTLDIPIELKGELCIPRGPECECRYETLGGYVIISR